MERSLIEKTGLEVKRLGFGGIPIQRVDEKQAVETVLHALRKGIDPIDTARGYATSQRRIRVALREVNKRVVVASKSHSYDNACCRRCDYCQPCTGDILIQVVLGIRSFVKSLGKGALKRDMFSRACEKERLCSECGECMTRCPYPLPIPDLIRKDLQWVDEQLASLE